MDNSKTIVTHEKVESNNKSGINYTTVVEQFGCQLIDNELISKVKQVVKKDTLHPVLENNIFFAHRDFDALMDKCLHEKKNNFYIYTGRGPSSTNLHLGHMIPFMTAKYLQDIFDVPVVIQITDDEKYYQTNSNIPFEQYRQYAFENIKDIIACGFNPKKTYIFLNSIQNTHFSHNSVKIQKRIKLQHFKNTFGFTDDDNIGKVSFPSYQMAPSFASSFPILLHPPTDDNPQLDSFYNPISSFFGQIINPDAHKEYLKQLSNMKCLIIAAVDQDPYFRTLRDIAPKINEPKPIVIYSRFIGSLQGKDKKMSASVNNSSIFLTDTSKQVKKKINGAFSGGQETLELHRQLGGNPDVDVATQYIEFFSGDTEMVAKVKEDFRSGQLLSGELKKKCIEIVNNILDEHRQNREKITNELISEFMSIRSLI
jgi:tryptophanyl-tRNA synthetase